MFPCFTSLSQREQKRQNLLKQANQDLENDDAKRQAYSQVMWADDVIKNNINLMQPTTSAASTSAQTESQNGVFSNSTDGVQLTSTIPPATSLIEATANLTLLPHPRSATAAAEMPMTHCRMSMSFTTRMRMTQLNSMMKDREKPSRQSKGCLRPIQTF